MAGLTIAEIAAETGLSLRYWQRRASRGEIPGTTRVRLGQRARYFIARETWPAWWATQCEKVLAYEVATPKPPRQRRSRPLPPSAAETIQHLRAAWKRRAEAG